jgi:sulfur carrier protein
MFMNISINGDRKSVPEGATLAGILELFDIVAATIVVEHNGVIVPPDSFTVASLADGDQLEFIRFVGGG